MRWLMLLLLMAPSAMAQLPRGMFAWWDTPIARDLNLSDDQLRQIRAAVRDHRGRLIDQRAALDKAEGEIDDLFNEETVDQKRAGDAIERLAAARADLTRTLTQMSLRLRSVLTPQQWRELQRRRPMGEQEGFRPSRGGPMGPGRGPGLRRPNQREEKQQEPGA
jgi:Spy/CpxP family protein refolding chaperone